MTPEERFERIETQIEKNTNGIRDLIAVSRAVLEAQERTGENIDALVEHQQVIDQKLLELTNTVGRIDQKLLELTGTVDRLSSNVDRLSLKIDKLSDSLSAFITGLQKPNGKQ